MKLFRSLSNKIFFGFLLILLPIAITFTIGYTRSKTQVKQHALGDLTGFVQAYEGMVYLFLEMSKRRVEDFSSDGFIRENLKKILHGDKNASKLLNGHLRRNKLVLDKTINFIHVISLDGRIVSSTDVSAIGRDVSNEVFFKEGRKNLIVKETVDQRKQPVLALSAPLTDKDTGELIGVITNFISFVELSKLLSGEIGNRLGALTWKEGRRETLEVYLVNNDKLVLTETKFTRDVVFKAIVNTTPVVECLGYNREMSGFYKNYRGIDVAGASMCMPQYGWTLIVEADTEEIFAFIKDMLRDAIVTAVIVIVFMGGFYFVFMVTVLKPIKMVSKGVEEIDRGNYDVAVGVSANDEIGRLAEVFNKMAVDVKNRTSALKKSERSLSEAQRVAHLGSWEWDIIHNEFFWSDETYRIFDLKPLEFEATYEAFLNSVHPEDRDVVRRFMEEVMEEKKPSSLEHRIVLRGGAERIVHEKAEVIYNGSETPVRILGTIHDITDIKEREFEIKKLSMAIEQSINIIFITDRKGFFQYVNPVFEKATGYTKDEVIGQKLDILASGEGGPSEYSKLWNTIDSGRSWRGVFKNRKKNGEVYWADSVITPLMNTRGEITNFLAIQEDITKKMRAEKKIKYLVEHDDLTGLYNRSQFMNLIDEWILRNKQSEGITAVLLIVNMDHFKEFNDTYGHIIGDEYLRTCSRMLELSMRSVDVLGEKEIKEKFILARLGGDEFGIFMPSIAIKEAQEIAGLIREIVEGVHLGEGFTTLTASVGIAFFPEHAATTNELFTRSDAALHRVKEKGGNDWHIYRAEDRILEEMHLKIKQKSMVVTALEKNYFEPWFQSILDLKDNTIRRYEVLARMRGEDGNAVLPAFFIDVAERFGLIGRIDRVVMEKAMRILSEMNRKGRHLSFSLNLSGKNIGDEEIFSFIKERMAEYDIYPGQLVFEITETEAVKDLERAMVFIKELKKIGCQFALDDFGVGFTSFIYLKQLGVDYVKIDGSFVRKLNESKHDQLFVKAITDVSHGMGIKVVAEFVENEAVLNVLKEIKVDYAQGYHIGKPMPSSSLD